MSDEPKQWWQTLPAIVGGSATLVTALTGLLVALGQAGLFKHTDDKPKPTPIVEPAKPGDDDSVFPKLSGKPASGAWLLPESSSRLLRDEDLASFDCNNLWRARNEIFARNGYMFSTPRGRDLTASLGSAYRPKDANQERVLSNMNAVEKDNILRISSFETRRNCH